MAYTGHCQPLLNSEFQEIVMNICAACKPALWIIVEEFLWLSGSSISNVAQLPSHVLAAPPPALLGIA